MGWRLWAFDATPGAAGLAPSQWPVHTSLKLDSHVDTLVLMLHPQCGCSRATVGELNQLMSDCQGKIAATVLVLQPSGMPQGWEKTDLWRNAAAIPGVRVVSDRDGEEMRRFGGATSGQALAMVRATQRRWIWQNSWKSAADRWISLKRFC